MTASWRPQGQTQSHMYFSYLHIISHSVRKLNFRCSTALLVATAAFPRIPHMDRNTASFLLCPDTCLLREGKCSAVNSSWRLNDKQWARGPERTEQESVQTLFSCQFVSMCYFLLTLRACSRSPGMCIYHKDKSWWQEVSWLVSYVPLVSLSFSRLSLLEIQEMDKVGE